MITTKTSRDDAHTLRRGAERELPHNADFVRQGQLIENGVGGER